MFVMDCLMNFRMSFLLIFTKMAPEMELLFEAVSLLFQLFSAGVPFDALCAVLASILARFWSTWTPFRHPVGHFGLPFGTLLLHFCVNENPIREAPADNRRLNQGRRRAFWQVAPPAPGPGWKLAGY
jgi:hypothetical protein